MTVKLSQNSFVTLLSRSGLIADDVLKQRTETFENSEANGQEESAAFAQFLVRSGDLTTWQVKKLLQGKHKGFFLGKYKLLSLLGRGGMSSVYLAEHVVMRRRVAIKVLPSKQVNDSAALTRFHQEAQAVAALDDPNIVRAYDVDHVQEGNSQIHFLVMEYVEGRSLQEVVDQDGPLSIADTIDYICQSANGLGHAHEAGMVHRDIKPSNLLLDLNGTVKVLDMGLARFFEQTDQQSLTLQHDQKVLGTADYLSPEQAVDSHGVDTRSDIYSLGGTMYYLLSGHPPFPEGTLAQRLLAHQTRKPKPINEVRSDVPASLARILERMMAKNPDDRQATAIEVREELQAWLDENGAAFADLRPPARAEPRNRRVADRTSDGWMDIPEEFLQPQDKSGSVDDGSNVVGDPGLGQFLSGLSGENNPSNRDSERITSAKTVVSKSNSATSLSQPPVNAKPAEPSGVSVTADSGVRSKRADSKTLSGSQIRRRQTQRKILIPVVAGGGLLLLVLAGFALWGGSDAAAPGSVAQTTDTGATGTDAPATSATPPKSSRPPVSPTGDITVGANGNFATITEAIEYVSENFQPLSPTAERTIRVDGGMTYAESIVLDNTVFGSHPQGIRIVCEDPDPAVLAPPGTDPIVQLVNIERFRLQGFHLAGDPRPVAARVEGYLGGTIIEHLTIENAQHTAIDAYSVSGIGGNRTEFRNILIHNCAAGAVGLSLSAGDRSTKDVLVDQCRLAGPLSVGLRISGEAANVEVSECRFNDVREAVAFTNEGSSLENIRFNNNTFHQFEKGITFATPPSVGSRGIGFHKNLFAGEGGPEVVVKRGAAQPAEMMTGIGARFNWSTGSAELSGEAIDIFQNDGRRGVSELSFAGTDEADAWSFLKPKHADLKAAAQPAPAPKFIGAVAPQ